jgi:hypothetical protein
LGGFANRREIYLKRFTDGQPRNFKGRVEETFESKFRESLEDLEFDGKLGTEAVVKGETFEESMLEFIGGQKRNNPFQFYRQIFLAQTPSLGTRKFKALSTYIHGDLNASNVIVNTNGDIRILDFARLVKDGPLEFDFAELEVDIRVRSLVRECEVSEGVANLVRQLFTFEERMLEVFSGTGNLEDSLVSEVAERFRPGFVAIKEIREKAIGFYQNLTNNELSRVDVLMPYMTAMYFESLAAMAFDIEPLAKTWALIAATVACEKIFLGDNETLEASA